jgi:hypothetical protein
LIARPSRTSTISLSVRTAISLRCSSRRCSIPYYSESVSSC